MRALDQRHRYAGWQFSILPNTGRKLTSHSKLEHANCLEVSTMHLPQVLDLCLQNWGGGVGGGGWEQSAGGECSSQADKNHGLVLYLQN